MATQKVLKQILAAGEFVAAPGVFDMFSALIANELDFKALYITGYGISASYLGLADAGLVSYTDMVGRAGTIARAIDKPLIADAHTRFRGRLNSRHTIRLSDAQGVQAIQLDNQDIQKK